MQTENVLQTENRECYSPASGWAVTFSTQAKIFYLNCKDEQHQPLITEKGAARNKGVGSELI